MRGWSVKSRYIWDTILYFIDIIRKIILEANIELCYGTKNEQENTQNNVVEVNIIRDMTVDKYKNTKKRLKQLPKYFVN